MVKLERKLFKKIHFVVFFFFSFYFLANGAENIEICHISKDRVARNLIPMDGSENIENLSWHIRRQEILRSIDPLFHPKNLCFLQLKVEYFNQSSDSPEGKTVTVDFDFDNILFISGQNTIMSSSNLGTIEDFNERTYKLILEEDTSPHKKPNLPGNLEQEVRNNSFLRRYQGDAKMNSLICIEDYYDNLDIFHANLLNYFGLKTVLGQHFGSMENFFSNTVNKLSIDSKLREQINGIYKNSLKHAPFNNESKAKIKEIFPFCTTDEMCQNMFDNTPVNFCDSEQSIRLFLTEVPSEIPMNGKKKRCLLEKWEKLYNELLSFGISIQSPENFNTIQKIIINIGSRRYMCDYCAYTYLYDLNPHIKLIQKGILRNLLNVSNANLKKPIGIEILSMCKKLENSRDKKEKQIAILLSQYEKDENLDSFVESVKKTKLKGDQYNQILQKIEEYQSITIPQITSDITPEIEVFVSGSINHGKK